MELKYETRDGKGNDIIKMVKIKEFPVENVEFICPICKKEQISGVKTKKAVSSKFTDFEFIGDYICENCSQLFTLYFYSYIVDPDGIRLLNVRQIRDELVKRQKPPFRFIITTTQKKHLFYRSKINHDSNVFAVNLETETIYTSCERMEFLFSLIECLVSLGASKTALSNGEIPFAVIQKMGFSLGEKVLSILNSELQNSREIQIPLFCGQKLQKTEEELCFMILKLTTLKEQKQP